MEKEDYGSSQTFKFDISKKERREEGERESQISSLSMC
jgi:hypothetical protein